MLLETARLHLRPFAPDDLHSLHLILSDPLTMSFWPSPYSSEQTKEWLANNKGRLAVILKESGKLIGYCGIISLEIDGVVENDLGYIIHHPYWNRGYATEAALACAAYGFETLHLSRLCANMPAEHSASRRVAEKIGMRLEREFLNPRNRGILTCLYVGYNKGDDAPVSDPSLSRK